MIAAVIPAAGQSRRMGVAKQLLPLGKSTVIEHIVDQILLGGINEVHVVVGHQADRIRAALSGRPIDVVDNPDYQRGEMLSSVRCGLRALSPGCDAVLVALGDQPAITAGLIRAMIESYATVGRGIIVPVFEGRRGHPLLLATAYRDEILTGYDHLGLRGLLAAHPQDIFELPVATSAVLSDMDDLRDYQREAGRFRGQ
jgi:molybdenum cofactor cytidylyltransferase